MTDKTPCRTPAKDRDGVTNIPTWKFDLLRTAVLAALADGPIPFRDLKDRVSPRLTKAQRTELGSLGWHVTTVKLELEVRGEIRRIPGATPQQIEAV